MSYLLWFVAGLLTCGLVTAGPTDTPQSTSNVHWIVGPHAAWAAKYDDVPAMEAELLQQASEISRLKAEMSEQTATFNSQMEQQATFFQSQIAEQSVFFKSQLAALTSQMTSLQTTCDIHRAVRSDDVSPMEVVLQQQASEITSLKAQVTTNGNRISTLQDQLARVNMPLVFSGEGQAARQYNDGETIHFDRLLTNVGDMYDSLSGIVTVPQDGVYFIFLRSDPPPALEDYLTLELRVNNVHQVFAFAEKGTLGSVAVALSLTAGNTVHVIKDGGTGDAGWACNLSVVRVSA